MFSRSRAGCSAAPSRHRGSRTKDKKTRKRTEGAVAANGAKHIGDSSSAQVSPDPMCLTSFGDDSTEPLALSRRKDALVDKGAAVPKSCLPPHTNSRRWLSHRHSLYSEDNHI